MSAPLTDQLRAYFDDVDRRQGAIDVDALLRSVEERGITIELSPDEAEASDRTSSGRRWLILIAAAAVVVGVAVVVSRDVDDATPADEPSPTVTVSPTLPPRELFNNGGHVELAPGTLFVDEVDGTSTPRIYATIGTGWWDKSTAVGWDHITKMDDDYPSREEPPYDEPWWERAIGYIMFSQPVAVFSDACHPNDGFKRFATVDGFVSALREQEGGWVDVTAPTDISVDGYVGKAFQRTAPAVMSGCTNRNDGSTAPFPSWENAQGRINGGYAPGQIETLWVLDLNGTIVVISTELRPRPSATADADFADAVLASIHIAT